ncbi:MetS family NSS transporter small subunit [Marivirga lumbricoides]
MSTEAIIGMMICLLITVGGFLVFLVKAIKSGEPDKD